jgi:probable HAF family extracellular repeat protein
MSLLRSLACIAIVMCACLPALNAQSSIKTAKLTFTTIDVPGAAVTGVYGINNLGAMVGYYGSADNDPHKHGFLFENGSFTYLDYPGSYATFAYGINDSGLIVGGTEFSGGTQVRGFSFDGLSYKSIGVKGMSSTITYGLNNLGDLSGGDGTIYTTKGFQLVQGRVQGLAVPGNHVYVFGSGINSHGVVVGWADSDGFLCRRGVCQIIDVPGANQTALRGVNDDGLIVGWYSVPSCLGCGFLLQNGRFFSFSYPGAVATYAGGVNSLGEIVGQYTFDFTTYHGFVTSSIDGLDSQ